MAIRFSKEEFLKKADDLMSEISCEKRIHGDWVYYEGYVDLKNKHYSFVVTFCFNVHACYCSTYFYLGVVNDFGNSFGCITKKDLDNLIPPFYEKLPRKGVLYQGNLFEDLDLFTEGI